MMPKVLLMNNDLKRILNYLKEKRSFDFSGYRTSMVERRVQGRFSSTKCKSYNDYFNYLQENFAELDKLLDVLTINVSRFFRDTLTFEYIADRVLSAIVREKQGARDRSLRVWSAGCSMGEEPYSIAILMHDFFKKETLNFQAHIFATDIDAKILKKAHTAIYPFESVKNAKYRLLNKYFVSKGKLFQLVPEIKELVSFSDYDLLDKRSYAPPESIFGSFDMVFCRNVLIYFDIKHQDQIFDKLYRSLSKSGYLVLGEAEIPSAKHKRHFRRVNECCHIYQKV
jgi:chemotaxis protein methyltransferase CheR